MKLLKAAIIVLICCSRAFRRVSTGVPGWMTGAAELLGGVPPVPEAGVDAAAVEAAAETTVTVGSDMMTDVLEWSPE